jgi:ABC-type uncharacterized transport system substrate-binding protein
MEDLSKLDLFTLVDLLAKNTSQFMKLFIAGNKDMEYIKCKKMIQNLTAEIEYRKQKSLGQKVPILAKDKASR